VLADPELLVTLLTGLKVAWQVLAASVIVCARPSTINWAGGAAAVLLGPLTCENVTVVPVMGEPFESTNVAVNVNGVPPATLLGPLAVEPLPIV
jgi:hypothetical protein